MIQDIPMNVEKGIQLNGCEADNGVNCAHSSTGQEYVADEIFDTDFDYHLESGHYDDDMDGIDNEFPNNIVNYAEHDDECDDDLNGYNDSDLEDIQSKFQNDVARCNNYDADGDADSNKDHQDDGNGSSNNLDNNSEGDFYLVNDNDKKDVGDEVDDFEYGATNAVQENDQDDGLVRYQYKNVNQTMQLSVRYCGFCEESGQKTNNDNCASEYFTCEDEEDEVVADMLPPNEARIKTVSSDSHEEIARLYSSMQLLKCDDLCRAKQYEHVMNTLEEFQVQSKWEEHKRLTSGLQRPEISLDMKIVLFLEQGIAEIMQRHFSSAKKLFRHALQLCPQSNNLCLLQGRALMFLGDAYRNEGPIKYGKAFKCLTLAQQNLSLVESKEDKAELNYFLGVLYLNILNVSMHEPSRKSRDRIEQHYQAVYDYAMAESAARVREKIQRIFPLGMANFLLDGQTELARSRVVPEMKLKKAEDCLKYFAQNFPLDEQSISMQTDYCRSMSDLEYRRGNFYLSQVSECIVFL